MRFGVGPEKRNLGGIDGRKKFDPMVGQAMGMGAFSQQCDVSKRWIAILFVAIGKIGDGVKRVGAAVRAG